MHRDGPSLIDERSCRLVEWFLALLAVVAAVLIGIRRRDRPCVACAWPDSPLPANPW